MISWWIPNNVCLTWILYFWICLTLFCWFTMQNGTNTEPMIYFLYFVRTTLRISFWVFCHTHHFWCQHIMLLLFYNIVARRQEGMNKSIGWSSPCLQWQSDCKKQNKEKLVEVETHNSIPGERERERENTGKYKSKIFN